MAQGSPSKKRHSSGYDPLARLGDITRLSQSTPSSPRLLPRRAKHSSGSSASASEVTSSKSRAGLDSLEPGPSNEPLGEVNWKERCLELQLELQRNRAQATRTRDMLRDKAFPLSSQRQKVVDFHQDCMETHGIVEDAIHEALDGSPPDEQAFYEHMFCVAKKAKIISADGVVNTDNFETNMKDVIEPQNMEYAAKLVRKCFVQREDVITTIKEGVHCFVKEDHNL